MLQIIGAFIIGLGFIAFIIFMIVQVSRQLKE